MSAIKTTIRALVGASLVAAAVPAAASTVAAATANSAAAAEEGKAEAKDKRLICKRLEQTGSRMNTVKACHTAEDWKKIERDNY